MELNNNLIIQFGHFQNVTSVTFPISFTVNCSIAHSTPFESNDQGTTSFAWVSRAFGYNSYNTTGFKCSSYPIKRHYIAIGF